LTLVENRKQRPKKPRVKIPRLLPILLNLSVYANEINQNSKFSLLDAVQDLMNNEGQLSVPRPWIKDKLSRGKCLILLDGLDEIADAAARDRMSEWVQKQLGVWGKNHFILTSRPYGYIENKLRGVDLKEIQPFTTKQIELFIKQWYLASEIRSQEKEDSAVREKAQNAARDLLRFLYSDTDLLLLAVNPLLLTMIAMVHRESNSIPDKRVKLYAEACEVFLRNHQKAHGVAQVLTSAQIQQVLQHLALHLMEKGEQKIRLTDAQKVIAEPMREAGVDMQPEKFLQLVQNTSGLLLKHEPKTYSFAHLSFQAYLAAVAINKEDEKKKEATLNTEKSEQKEAYLISKVREKWWHETIRFYCALEDDATALINECLKEDTLSVSTLILAHDCIEEARSFKPSVRDQLETLVDEGIEHPDPNRRRIIGEVLLKQNLRNMIYLHEGVLIDQKLVTCAEYQVFLDEQNANGLCNQPYHWNTKSFPVGEGRDPILGVQPLDVIAFCHWLTKQDESLAWLYRLPKEEEHNIIKRDLSSTLKLKPETGYWVNEGEKFVWANEIAQLPDDLESSIRKLWNKDWTRDRISDQEFDLARILNNVRDHISDLNEKKDFSLDGGIIRDQDITRAVSLLCALNLTHIQGIDFNPINLRKQTL
ncbi:MAG: NACHT domain-containing protein, partial [Ktedonobacteraceae bacterium]